LGGSPATNCLKQDHRYRLSRVRGVVKVESVKRRNNSRRGAKARQGDFLASLWELCGLCGFA
jgi:hypothetical protein